MAVKVVLDGPRRHKWDQFGWPVLTVLGGVLVGARLVALVAVVPLVALTGLEWFTPGDGPLGVLLYVPHAVRTNLHWAWTAAAGCVIAGSLLGVRLRRGRRGLVLFLRRFQHAEAITTITAATTSIGRTWRFVTLFDTRIDSIGTRRMPELAVDTAGLLGVFGGAIVDGVLWLARRAAVAAAAVAAITAVIEVVEPASPDWVRQTLLWSAIVLAASVGAYVAVWLGKLAMWPLRRAFDRTYSATFDASVSKDTMVRTEADIEPARRAALSQSHLVLGARLIVLHVDTSIWQQVVVSVAEVASLPLIDISEPTDHVLWEVGTLIGRFGRRCVFVGEQSRVHDLLRPDSSAGDLRALLDGHQVLVYTTDRAGIRRYVQALRATLEERARLPWPAATTPTSTALTK